MHQLLYHLFHLISRVLFRWHLLSNGLKLFSGSFIKPFPAMWPWIPLHFSFQQQLLYKTVKHLNAGEFGLK